MEKIRPIRSPGFARLAGQVCPPRMFSRPEIVPDEEPSRDASDDIDSLKTALLAARAEVQRERALRAKAEAKQAELVELLARGDVVLSAGRSTFHSPLRTPVGGKHRGAGQHPGEATDGGGGSDPLNLAAEWSVKPGGSESSAAETGTAGTTTTGRETETARSTAATLGSGAGSTHGSEKSSNFAERDSRPGSSTQKRSESRDAPAGRTFPSARTPTKTATLRSGLASNSPVHHNHSNTSNMNSNMSGVNNGSKHAVTPGQQPLVVRAGAQEITRVLAACLKALSQCARILSLGGVDDRAREAALVVAFETLHARLLAVGVGRRHGSGGVADTPSLSSESDTRDRLLAIIDDLTDALKSCGLH